MAIVWTKDWSGADDGAVLGGIDLKNIQDDLASVTTAADIGTVTQAHDDDLDVLSSPDSVNSANLVINGAFDNFPVSPTPSNWTVEGGGVEAEDTTNVRVGASAYEITSDADGSASRQTVYSTIDGTENSYWRGRIVTLTAQVYATVASNARIQVDDGISTSESSYHTGTTGFEELKVAHTIDSSATKLDVVLLVDGNVLTATFDAVRLNNGGSSWEFIRHSAEGNTGLSNTFTSIQLTETAAPTTLLGEGALYTKDVGGQPELFFRTESDGTEVQLTSGAGLGSGTGGSIFVAKATQDGSGQFTTAVTIEDNKTYRFEAAGNWGTGINHAILQFNGDTGTNYNHFSTGHKLHVTDDIITHYGGQGVTQMRLHPISTDSAFTFMPTQGMSSVEGIINTSDSLANGAWVHGTWTVQKNDGFTVMFGGTFSCHWRGTATSVKFGGSVSSGTNPDSLEFYIREVASL